MKEIGFSSDSQAMDIDSKEKETQERGHSSNSIFTNVNDEEWEEFEQVTAIMEAD